MGNLHELNKLGLLQDIIRTRNSSINNVRKCDVTCFHQILTCQEFKKETGFGQVCKNRIITPSGKKKLCNNNLTLLFVISTFLNSYIGMLTGEKINYDTWSISGEIYIIESKGTCTCFYFMFVPHSLCNI